VSRTGDTLNVSIAELGSVKENPCGVVEHPELTSADVLGLLPPYAEDPRRRGRIRRTLHGSRKFIPVFLQSDSRFGHKRHTTRAVEIAIRTVKLDNKIVNDLAPVSDSNAASAPTRSSDASCRNAVTTFLG
jgi:hypothetical protein